MMVALFFICWWLMGFIPMIYHVTKTRDVDGEWLVMIMCVSWAGPIVWSVIVGELYKDKVFFKKRTKDSRQD